MLVFNQLDLLLLLLNCLKKKKKICLLFNFVLKQKSRFFLRHISITNNFFFVIIHAYIWSRLLAISKTNLAALQRGFM